MTSRERLPYIDCHLRSLRIRAIDRHHSGSPNGALLFTGVIDDEFVALFHLAQVLYCLRIRYTIPHGGLFFLEIRKGVGGGFSLQEVEHRSKSSIGICKD